MLVSHKVATEFTYTWVKRDTLIVKCIAQEHNPVALPGLKPGPLKLMFLILPLDKL